MSEFEGVKFSEIEDFEADELESLSFIEAMPRVVGARMHENDAIYVFGEDVANMGGGKVGDTSGLLDQYADRIINTPITEQGFDDLATGAAIPGARPQGEE